MAMNRLDQTYLDQNGGAKKTPSAFTLLDEAISRLADAVNRVENVTDTLCGPAPSTGGFALSEVPPSGLLGSLESDVERVNRATERLSSYAGRIESRLP